MSNLSLQQKVNDYFHRNKPAPKRRDVPPEDRALHSDFSELRDKLPEDVKALIQGYREQHPTMFQEIDLYHILKKFDFNRKVADDYINVLVQRAKEINSGVWIQVSQRSRTKIPKEKGEDKGRENEAGKEKQKKDNYYEPAGHYQTYNRGRFSRYNEEHWGNRTGNEYGYRKFNHSVGKGVRKHYRNYEDYEPSYPEYVEKKYIPKNPIDVKFVPKNPDLRDYEVTYVPKSEVNTKTEELKEERVHDSGHKRTYEKTYEKKPYYEKTYEPKEVVFEPKEKTHEAKEKTHEPKEKAYEPKQQRTPYKSTKPTGYYPKQAKYDYRGRKKYIDDAEIEYIPKVTATEEPTKESAGHHKDKDHPNDHEHHKEHHPKETHHHPHPPKDTKEQPKESHKESAKSSGVKEQRPPKDKEEVPSTITAQSLQEKLAESLDIKKPDSKKEEPQPQQPHPTPNPNPNNPPAYSQFPMKSFQPQAQNPTPPQPTLSKNPPNLANNQPIVNSPSPMLQSQPTTTQPQTLQQQSQLPGIQMGGLMPNMTAMPNMGMPMGNFNLPVLYLMMPNGQQVPVLLTPMPMQQAPPQNNNMQQGNEANMNMNMNMGSFGFMNGKDNQQMTINPIAPVQQFPYTLNFHPIQSMPVMGGGSVVDLNAKNDNNLQPKENVQPSNFYLSNPNNFFPTFNQSSNPMYYNNK